MKTLIGISKMTKKILLGLLVILGLYLTFGTEYIYEKKAPSIIIDMTEKTEVAVDIRNFAFEPGNVRVSAGTKVTWVNKDNAAHTIIADEPYLSELKSEPFDSGAGYSFVFDKAGTYAYHCGIHPSMKGTIIVESR